MAPLGVHQPMVAMPNMAEVAVGLVVMARRIVLVKMAGLLFMEAVLALVVAKKAGTHLGPLVIGEVIRLALVPPHEPQTRQASQEQVESSAQAEVALVAVAQMEEALVKLVAQEGLHQAEEAAVVSPTLALVTQAEQEPEAR